ELRLIRLVAEQAAVAMRQSELYREVRESATRAALVNQIIHGINQSNHLDEIFPIVAEQLGKYLAADRLTITRRQEGSQVWVNECEYGGGKISRTRRTFENPEESFDALFDGDAIRCDDTLNDPRLTPGVEHLLRQAGTRSFVTVRVAFNGESHLVINALMRESARHWLDEEVEVMLAVANQVRLALQRAEQFDLASQGKIEWESPFDALTDA